MRSKKKQAGVLTYFLYSIFLGALCIFVFKSCSKVIKEEVKTENLVDESIRVELGKCRIDLEQYKTCCQACLTDKVNKAVNIKSR